MCAWIGIRHSTSGNPALIEALTKWTFQEQGLLKVMAISHHRVGETESPKQYRVKDEVVSAIL